MRRRNSQVQAHLKRLESAEAVFWRGDPRASLSLETLRGTYDKELDYRSEIVAKTQQLVNAATLVVTLMSAGVAIVIAIGTMNADYRLAVLVIVGIAMLYFLVSWRMILTATEPARVFQYALEDAVSEPEGAGILRAIEHNRQVNYLILNRSAVARNAVWRALLWASGAFGVVVVVAYAGLGAGGVGTGEGDGSEVDRGEDVSACCEALEE